jgi:lipopolysaccharide export LptBFGC system permease protein LptF
MIWLNYHAVLLRHFLVNLGRAVVVLSAVTVIFSLLGADWWDDPWPYGWEYFLAILDWALPLSLLVATLFTVGPRAHFKELTALTSAGFSMFQIMWPVFCVAALAAVYALILRLAGLPLGGPVSTTQAELQTAFHADLASPLINVFAVVAGIVLTSSPTRKSVYSGFLAAFFAVVAFTVVNVTAQILGRHEVIPPLVGGWAGTVVGMGALWVKWRRSGL